MPTMGVPEAAKKMGLKKIFFSQSRVDLAKLADDVFVKTMSLFDLSSIGKLDKWILKYARNHLFQKLQTLFQMGKKQELLDLITFLEEKLPEMRKLANNPDVFVTSNGKFLDEDKTKEKWASKPIDKDIETFLVNKYLPIQSITGECKKEL